MCVCVYVCTRVRECVCEGMITWVHWPRMPEALGFLGTGIIGSCELSCGYWELTSSSLKEQHVLNHWATPPAPKLFFNVVCGLIWYWSHPWISLPLPFLPSLSFSLSSFILSYRVSLWGLDWPGTWYLGQDALELREIYLLLHADPWG